MRCPKCNEGELRVLPSSVPLSVICNNTLCHAHFVVEEDGSLSETSALSDSLAELKEEGVPEFDLGAKITQLSVWDGNIPDSTEDRQQMTKKEDLKRLLIFYSIVLAVVISGGLAINWYFGSWFVSLGIPSKGVLAVSFLVAFGLLGFGFVAVCALLGGFFYWSKRTGKRYIVC